MNAHDLIQYIFEQNAEDPAASCLHGFQTCPRFKEFAWEYRNKLRSKVRNGRDPDALAAVWCEFALAWWLLQERRFNVLYEPYLKDKQKGPDFAVRFKEYVVFNVEVTRVRSVRESGSKLAEIVCGKLSQMPASAINLLVVVMDHAVPKDADLLNLLKRADCKEEEYFLRQGFGGSKDFLRHCNRLSGVLVRAENSTADSSRLLWLNVRATHRIPGDLRRVLERLPFVDPWQAKPL